MQPSHERRKSPRTTLDVPVSVSLTRDGIFQFTAITRDLSETGVFLSVDADVQPGHEVELELKLPGDTEPMRIRGAVVRVEKMESGNTGVAVAFKVLEVEPR